MVDKCVQNIFNTMDYGDSTYDNSLAKKWLKEKVGTTLETLQYNEKYAGEHTKIYDINTKEYLISVLTPDIAQLKKIDQSLIKFENTTLSNRPYLISKLVNIIEKNTELICQLEMSIRGILPKETKTKYIPLMIEYMKYYASFVCPKEDVSFQDYACFSEYNSIALIGAVIGRAMSRSKILKITSTPKLSVVIAAILKMAYEAGFPEGSLKLMPYWEDKLSTIVFTSTTDDKHSNKWFFGKIPMVIFSYADIDSACNCIVEAAWGHQGNLPYSVTTILVQEDILGEFTKKLKCKVASIKMGNSNNKNADAAYPTLVENYIEKLEKVTKEAKIQGIEVYPEFNQTFRPTLLIGAKVFNDVLSIPLTDQVPCVTVLGFRTVNEGIALANNNKQGLAASVWTENISLVNEIVQKLNVGTVWVNSYGVFNPNFAVAPMKSSGYGCIGGIESTKNSYSGQIKLSNEQKSFNDSWKKMNIQDRITKVKSVADSIIGENSTEDLTKGATCIYNSIKEHSFGKSMRQGNFVINSFNEPVGAVVLNASKFSEDIPRAILYGNSVVVSNPNLKSWSKLPALCITDEIEDAPKSNSMLEYIPKTVYIPSGDSFS